MRLSFSHISIFECRKKSHLTNHQQSSFEVKPFRSDVFNIHKTPRRKRKGFALGLDQKRRKKKQCRGFRHSPAQQESSVFVGRAKRGRYHPADHMWSSSKTLREPALVRFDHRAACTGPRGLAVRQQHRGRLSPRAISVAQCSLSALPCPCIYVFAPHVHARMYLCVSCYYFPSVWERVL